MEYLTVKEMAEKWNLSDRRIRLMCSEGKIKGIIREGRSYRIPADAIRPVDGRAVRGKQIPEKYQELFAEIDSRKKEFHCCRFLTPEKKDIAREEFLERFIYHSNALSGNIMNLEETRTVLRGETLDQKPLKDLLEIVGHKEAFEYAEKMAKEKSRLSERVIRGVHARILVDKWEEKGHYRDCMVTPPALADEIPEPEMVPILIEQLIKNHTERRKKLHAIEADAIFHMEFRKIHPFADGNGRTNRMVLNFLLMEDGYLPICVKLEDKEKYLRAFQEYYLHDNEEPMVLLISEYMKKELEHSLYLGSE